MSSTTRVSNEVLRDLVVQYQKTVDSDVFTSILKRVDRLVYRVAHQLRHHPMFRYLRTESIDDLYQTGVIGIYKAVLRIPCDEDPDRVPAWFVSYIKNEILTSFPRPHPVSVSSLEEVWCPVEDDPCRENPSQCLEGVFKRMLEDQVVTPEEVELLTLHRIQGISLDAIGAMKGVCGDTISSRIHGALLRIQYRVRMLELEPEDCIPS